MAEAPRTVHGLQTIAHRSIDASSGIPIASAVSTGRTTAMQ